MEKKGAFQIVKWGKETSLLPQSALIYAQQTRQDTQQWPLSDIELTGGLLLVVEWLFSGK